MFFVAPLLCSDLRQRRALHSGYLGEACTVPPRRRAADFDKKVYGSTSHEQYRFEAVSMTRRTALAGVLFFLSSPARAGLQDYNVTDDPITEIEMALGTDKGDLKFVPDQLVLKQGTLYKLRLRNPSKMTHYFTPGDFANKIFTVLVTAGDPVVEIKGPVQEVALKAGGSLTWTFIPMKPGKYPFRCSVKGHTEAGMVGTIVVAPK
mmetsp:Transcript_23512/g.38633  ORF Transcript_23512/g.38633 Transcript_23512/m.38633 type:complete len:206 (+) Transcript_23512:29-646(+)